MTDQHHQAEDGIAHLAYYDKEHQISFVWNGRQGDRIDVCPGGYAEPANESYYAYIGFVPHLIPLDTALTLFRITCQRYIRDWCRTERLEHYE